MWDKYKHTGARDHDALVLEVLRRLAAVDETAEEACRRHGAGALDVVVEDAHGLARMVFAQVVAIVAEDVHRHVGAEVFELHKHVGKAPADSVQKLVHELEVGVTAQPVLHQAYVVRVLQEALVVGANVQGHGQHAVRSNAAGGAVERQLPDRDPHAVGAEVAEPEDARPVRDDYHLHLLVRPVCDARVHLAAIERANVHAARAAEAIAELLARQPHRGRVDDGRQELDVFDQQRVEERLVVVANVRQELVAVDVRRQGLQALHRLLHLQTHRDPPRRQEAAEPQAVPLRVAERCALVVERVLDDAVARGPHPQRRERAAAPRVQRVRVILVPGLRAAARLRPPRRVVQRGAAPRVQRPPHHALQHSSACSR